MRATRRYASAAVGLVAALAITTACAARTADPPTHSASRTAPQHDQHYTLTVQRVQAAIADLPEPDGARRLTSSPDHRLDEPAEEPQNGSRGIHRSAWWSATGSGSATLDFYRTHPAPGFTSDGSGTSDTLPFLSFGRADDNTTDDWFLLVAAVTRGNQVLIRVDVFAIWVPKRTAASTITDPTSVTVRVVRAGRAPTVSRKLGSPDAQALADVVNRLAPAPTGVYNCPAAFAGLADELSFATPTGTVAVRVKLSGCGGVSVTRRGQPPVELRSGGLDDAVLRALGLPAGYGER